MNWARVWVTVSKGPNCIGSYPLLLTHAVLAAASACRRRRLDKIQGFFGPGIVALLCPTEQGQDVALVCDGSGRGRGGDAKKDVLPPLMPGMKPRQQ